MKTSAEGRALIEAFEGLFLHAYYDSVHVLTIGYGHTNLANVPPLIHPGDVITKEQADAILGADLAAVEQEVCRFIKVPMVQCEFDALVSFQFNTGKLYSGTIDDKINAGNKVGAMQTLLQYDKAVDRKTQKLITLAGLVRRRNAEKLMFEGHVKEALILAK